MSKVVQDQEMLQLLDSRYGTKPLVSYYLKKAKEASARARAALISQNPYSLGAEAEIMIQNIEMMSKILGTDDAVLTETGSQKPGSV